MKNLKFLFCAWILGLAFSIVSRECAAAPVTVTVVPNHTSGIANAELTATLEDGTILGFYRSGKTKAFFCGAISQQKTLTVPDSILDSGYRIAVSQIGYSGQCDFDKAESITELFLHATITYVNALPSSVKVLHTDNYIGSVTSNKLVYLDKVLVPEANLVTYYENKDWSDYVLINAEGTEPLKITINMTKAGEFAQLLLQQIDNWYKVNELTVVGELNTNDLNVFKRMRQLTKLDLSRAIITDIPDNFDGSSATGADRDGFNILEKVILPEINSIGDYAFSQCYRLKDIKIPKVSIIGSRAFSRIGASQITLPDGVASIGDYAFYCSNLESVTIPSSVVEISEGCFQGCSRLMSITMTESVKTIGVSAFSETGLVSVSLPGIETIEKYAFDRCKDLTAVRIADGLQSLNFRAFWRCTSLTEIDLPGTLCSIEEDVFDDCISVKKITSRAIVPPYSDSSSILYGIDKTDVKLFVPAMSIDKYRTAKGWNTFYTILPMEDKISKAYIYDEATIDNGSEFTTDLDMTITWLGSSCGALDYSAQSTLSMRDYEQYQYLGDYSWDNPYTYGAHFTSLIANGDMRADNVQTVMQVSSTRVWYFISLPYDVKVSDITYTEGTQFAIRKYSGYNRAQQSGKTWLDLTADDTMHAYEGYILKCNNEDAEFIFPAINNANKNRVFEKGNVVMPLGEYPSEFEHNRSWNLVGNPYPCYYDTRQMDFTAPITVWNRYNDRYDAYSPLDDAYILHPAQAFFVQRPVDQSAIIFDKAGRQKDATAKDISANSARRVAMKADRKIYNIIMSDGTTDDRTRVVINGSASQAYELDKDASKFITDNNAAMLVYTVNNGVKYAINERPMESGIVALGFYAPVDGEYTLSMDSEEAENVILVDNETHTEISMTDGYHFYAKSGYNDSRFMLKFGEITGIGAINVANDIDSTYAVYTVDGRLVGNYSAGSTLNLAKGVYIISSKDVKRKIVVE